MQGFVATLRDLVAGAPVKHMDETGFRIGDKTCWLHVATTALLTFYRTCTKRGSLLANVAGIIGNRRVVGLRVHFESDLQRASRRSRSTQEAA